ncbi:hypothetical protein G9A89_011885 [Geosiphon pyriformis]|nr:hypothetical protein G9A89_011885 [Geosiphon pyriformis]
MESGFNIGVKSAESRKKRKGGALEDNIRNRKFVTAKSAKTGDTTESDSVDIEEECLVEETSFDYRKNSILTGRDLEQTPKSSKILIKRVLRKPLEKINFLDDNNDNILLEVSLTLSPSLKTLVDISVRKLFALDIGLDKMYEKSSQKKLSVIRKLFSGINATFTSELSLMKATEKTTDAKILVNFNFKNSTEYLDQAVILKEIPVETSAETVHIALSNYGVIVLIKIQLVGLWQKAVVKFGKIDQADLVAAYWSILIEKNAVHVARADKDKKS